ncbi:MAG: hypothetical protein ACKVUT_07110 [Gaiella sp.]
MRLLRGLRSRDFARLGAVKPDELAVLDATAQADLIRRRELTPLDAAIGRLERLNPAINAVTLPAESIRQLIPPMLYRRQRGDRLRNRQRGGSARRQS